MIILLLVIMNCINSLIGHMKSNEQIMTQCFNKILTILAKFPPAKNEMKFIYGKLIENTIVDHLNKIEGINCLCLDNNHTTGAEYKYDCSIGFNNLQNNEIDKYSIKASKNGGQITIINKRNRSDHSIDGMKFIICHIKHKRLYIFEHTDILKQFEKNDGSGIHYKSGIFKYLEKQNQYYQFPNNDILKQFEMNEFPQIKEVDIFQLIYDTL